VLLKTAYGSFELGVCSANSSGGLFACQVCFLAHWEYISKFKIMFQAKIGVFGGIRGNCLSKTPEKWHIMDGSS
jgi:hypothetical protein